MPRCVIPLISAHTLKPNLKLFLILLLSLSVGQRIHMSTSSRSLSCYASSYMHEANQSRLAPGPCLPQSRIRLHHNTTTTSLSLPPFAHLNAVLAPRVETFQIVCSMLHRSGAQYLQELPSSAATITLVLYEARPLELSTNEGFPPPR